jgi:hypothetical protein
MTRPLRNRIRPIGVWGWVMILVGLSMCYGGIQQIVETYYHKGGGIVGVYARHGPEWESIDDEWANEARYKSDQSALAVLVVGFGCVLAWCGMKTSKPDEPLTSNRRPTKSASDTRA